MFLCLGKVMVMLGFSVRMQSRSNLSPTETATTLGQYGCSNCWRLAKDSSSQLSNNSERTLNRQWHWQTYSCPSQRLICEPSWSSWQMHRDPETQNRLPGSVQEGEQKPMTSFPFSFLFCSLTSHIRGAQWLYLESLISAQGERNINSSAMRDEERWCHIWTTDLVLYFKDGFWPLKG